jgi:hypothetical protein
MSGMRFGTVGKAVESDWSYLFKVQKQLRNEQPLPGKFRRLLLCRKLRTQTLNFKL